MIRFLLIILFSLSFLPAQVVHKIYFDRFSHYEADDWVTYGYSNYITSIDIGPENVYFGTSDGGILRYNLFDEVWLFPLTTSNGLSSNRIQRVVFDYNTNQLYALTDKRIDVFNLAFQYWQSGGSQLPERRAADYSFQNQNDFRFPAFSRPPVSRWPNFFPQKNFTIMLDGIIIDPDNQQYTITDRIADNWYKLWIGTSGTGIAKADLDLLEIEFIEQSIPAIIPKDILITSNKLWVAGHPFNSDECGIASWDLVKDSWTYYKSGLISNLFSDKINAMASLKETIYFGTDQGLLAYNSKRDQWISYQRGNILKSDNINDLLTHNGLLYIASDYGFFSFDPRSRDFHELSGFLKQTPVFNITASDSLVYLASQYGIYQHNVINKQTTLFSTNTAIADNYISAVALGEGRLWFAGDNGIGFYDIVRKRWQSFPALRLSFKTRYRDIAIFEGIVWFATSDGLLKYDISRDYWYVYTYEDGLASNNVHRIDVDGDFLWLSTDEGITVFRWYDENGRIE